MVYRDYAFGIRRFSERICKLNNTLRNASEIIVMDRIIYLYCREFDGKNCKLSNSMLANVTKLSKL